MCLRFVRACKGLATGISVVQEIMSVVSKHNEKNPENGKPRAVLVHSTDWMDVEIRILTL